MPIRLINAVGTSKTQLKCIVDIHKKLENPNTDHEEGTREWSGMSRKSLNAHGARDSSFAINTSDTF